MQKKSSASIRDWYYPEKGNMLISDIKYLVGIVVSRIFGTGLTLLFAVKILVGGSAHVLVGALRELFSDGVCAIFFLVIAAEGVDVRDIRWPQSLLNAGPIWESKFRQVSFREW